MSRQPTTPRLPPEVIAIILSHTRDARARHSVLLSCKEYYEASIPYIYADVVLSSPRQVRCFAQTALMARSNALLARNFRHTRTFSFRISGTRSNDRYANDPTLDQRLYLALRDISNRTVDNIQQPTLFPNLTRAIFEPLPPLPPEVRYILSNQDGHDSQEFHPFLVAVKTVELLHRPTGNYDKAPDFHLFGMQKVEHLSIHHLFGAEISNTVDIQDYLGPQLRLRQVDFHLEDHIAWAMGSNAVNVVDAHASAATTARADNLPQQYNPFILQPVTAGGQRSLDVDWYIYEYTAALAYTVFKLAYFRKAHSTSNDTTPSHFPNLESIVIHLGDHGDSIIDEIAERTREKIAEYKKEYIDALQPDPSVSSLDEHRSSGTMPAQKSTKVEVRQRGGKTYRLNGAPLLPSQWGSYSRLWEEVG